MKKGAAKVDCHVTSCLPETSP